MIGKTLLFYAVIYLGGAIAQSINIGIPHLPAAYDPHDSQVVYTQRVLGDLYEGLVTEAADGSSISGTAESWERSEDGLTYTFKIRESAKWSDGKPVTAHDFLLSFERLFIDKSIDLERFQMIAGSEDWAKSSTKGVKVIDSNTLQFKLTKPYPLFLELMASPVTYPIPSHIWEKVKKDYFKPQNAVTNGAYTFKPNSFPDKDKLELVKNKHYWDHDNLKISSAVYLASTNSANATRSFSSGQYDVLYEFEGYQYKMLQKQFPEAIRSVNQLNGYYVLLNHNFAPLKNIAVREAMSLAIDRERLVQTTDAQNMRSLTTIIPSIRNYSSNTKFEFNLTKANQLMSSAGYSRTNPLELKFYAVDSKQDKRILSFLRHAWMSINVKVDIKFLKFKDYAKHMTTNDFQLTRLSWFAGLEDAYDFLAIYRGADKLNFGQYKSDVVDNLLLKSMTELDKEKRKRALSEAEAVMMSDVANIPLFSANILSLVHPKVKGWVDNATNTHRIRWLSIN